MHRILLLALFLGICLVSGTAVAESGLTETQKIERLIEHVRTLQDATFVRNDVEYDAAAAAKFLDAKWKSMGSDIKLATEFIEKIATRSSTTGKPYLIRFPNKTERPAGEYLTEILLTLK